MGVELRMEDVQSFSYKGDQHLPVAVITIHPSCVGGVPVLCVTTPETKHTTVRYNHEKNTGRLIL